MAVGDRADFRQSAAPFAISNRNPLDDIARHAPAPAIVNLGGPGVGMAGEVLHVFQRHVLIEQIGHNRDPEAVRGKQVRQARILEPALEHLPHGVRPVSSRRQLPALAVGGAEQRQLVVLAGDAGGVQVCAQPGIEIVTDRDLAHLAAFFAEAQGPLFAEIAQVAQAQPGDGADPRAGVGEHAEHGAIAQADDVTEVDRAQQFARLLDADSAWRPRRRDA